MNKLILCEGSSDAILLSYYLERTCGWEHTKAPRTLAIQVSRERDESAYWYKRGDDMLLICGVGGKDRFGTFFIEKIRAPQQTQNAFGQMAIVCDRDELSPEGIAQQLLNVFGGFLSALTDRAWEHNRYLDLFGEDQQLPVLLLTIPQEHEGALETLLMDAISENPYDQVIVDKSKAFVEAMIPFAERYIGSRRFQLKSKLSVVWAIQSPQKVFKFVDEQIRSVSWEQSEILRSCFHELSSM